MDTDLLYAAVAAAAGASNYANCVPVAPATCPATTSYARSRERWSYSAAKATTNSNDLCLLRCSTWTSGWLRASCLSRPAGAPSASNCYYYYLQA